MSTTYTATKRVGTTPDSGPPASRSDPAGLSPSEFEMFVREYLGRLLAVAVRFLRSEQDAADAVQDALLSAFASRATFQGDSTVYTWLYRIVVNVCLMKIRSRAKVKTVSLDAWQPTFDEQGRHKRRTIAWNIRAEDPLEHEETRAVVRACIDKLPNDYRTVLLLRDIDELDTDETAALLKLSRSAVKTRLYRARQELRTLLEPVLRQATSGERGSCKRPQIRLGSSDFP